MRIPQLQHLEDQQSEADERPDRPLQMALRNASVALLGIVLSGGAYWAKVHLYGGGGETYWWIWGAVAVFVVIVCFAHAFLASRFGARRAGNFLKLMAFAALAAMLLGLRWYLQPKDGG